MKILASRTYWRDTDPRRASPRFRNGWRVAPQRSRSAFAPKPGGETKFDAVLCAAVLQHIPDHQLFASIYRLQSLLKPRGFLMISVPTEYPVDAHSRDSRGRLTVVRPPDQYRFLLERQGLRYVVDYEESDGLGRENVRRHTLLFSA